MNKHAFPFIACIFFATLISGCASQNRNETTIICRTIKLTDAEFGRHAISQMAGTFKVEFDFEESIAIRRGYPLQKPYHTEAEELVVVVENQPEFVSLQHILVVRHEGEAHIIKHWRQDWRYEGKRALRFTGDDTWAVQRIGWGKRNDRWVQTVYNADDSPRYTSVGQWRPDGQGVYVWDGDAAPRPVPLRDNPISDQYSVMLSQHSLVVTDTGWLHLQRNHKLDQGPGDAVPLCYELGRNRYTRIADKGFDKAHEYWKNTAPYWRQVRAVWDEVIDGRETITLADNWKGDEMFTHLFGIADEYWDQPNASEARPRIQEVIQAFVVSE